MHEKPVISMTPIVAAAFLVVLVGCGYLIWHFLPAAVTPPLVAPGPASGPGFEVRYNAVIALAQRGSPRAVQPSPQAVAESVGLAAPLPALVVLHGDDRLAILREMLDEEWQLRNFRVKLQDGREAADEVAARTTVVSALKALVELQRRQPNLKLDSLRPAIERLASSSNPVVQQEAARTQALLR
jgi:hypothetical protein